MNLGRGFCSHYGGHRGGVVERLSWGERWKGLVVFVLRISDCSRSSCCLVVLLSCCLGDAGGRSGIEGLVSVDGRCRINRSDEAEVVNVFALAVAGCW